MRATFPSMLGSLDQHLFAEGTHQRLWEILGAHVLTHDGIPGVHFAVWAPNAQSVRVIGDFCHWDGNAWPLQAVDTTGVFEGFVPRVSAGALYKFEIHTADGDILHKADPMARWCEQPPATASRVYAASHYAWNDLPWLQARKQRPVLQSPLAIYEVHLGSWARHGGSDNRVLTYRELAPKLVAHVQAMGFNAIELLPIAEHPFTGSWGYQVTGYYAPTARYGTPDDFKYFVDYCHQHQIMVILDWVPAHFPNDAFALRCFDGTMLYEHADPRRGVHPDWHTLIFDYGRNEVRNFLMANALYWLGEFHIDGLRVDAVASMLYLDYSRRAGEWLPNVRGGHENLEAIAFLQQLTATIQRVHPDCLTIAEESTAWPGVTRSVAEGGLGFTFKWNMGWMHDTLTYFQRDPIHRQHHHDQLTFAALYEQNERFIMPLSHDEVVHGKGSLLRRMPGDPWQQFANLRTLLLYQMTRPGKKLLFMGCEWAQDAEWDHDRSLDWHVLQQPRHATMWAFVQTLGTFYRDTPSLWTSDHVQEGFDWIDYRDAGQSVLAYVRYDTLSSASAMWKHDHSLVVFNLTPTPRPHYRLGVPCTPTPDATPNVHYMICINSDAPQFGGSGAPIAVSTPVTNVPFHGFAHSIVIDLPPLAGIVLQPRASLHSTLGTAARAQP